MTKGLHNLKPAAGSTRERKRIGRGQGSGRGGTATRGHKGHASRSGFSMRPGFEGGQMPIQRRLPKFGFNNPFRKEYNVVTLERLSRFLDAHPETTVVDVQTLLLHRVVRKKRLPLKVLSNGGIERPVRVVAEKVSAAAREAIEKAGGSVEIVQSRKSQSDETASS
ncbi:MAG: 50S ribosomal protein L15 [Bacteroidia bacterium]|nr:50S ribosomal protein L15 [Bacteroidia bacterium]MDW8332676.1 50S ribosomal protein L15 [Bacteroidia bacterium]